MWNHPQLLPIVITCLALQLASQRSLALDPLDLAGEWRFQLDPQAEGTSKKFYSKRLSHAIKLPGSLQEQGYGDVPSLKTQWTGNIVDRSFFESPKYKPYRSPDNFKVPFWLQPRRHYVGVAWYQRDISIPPEWSGKRIMLKLERCHWRSTVWVDDQRIGTLDSLSTPHEYDLTSAVTSQVGEQRTHTITIRIDNRIQKINVGPNSHSVADHTQSNWNGIVGDIYLRAMDRVWIDDVQVYPNVTTKALKAIVTLGNVTGQAGQGQLHVHAQPIDQNALHELTSVDVPVSLEQGKSSKVSLEYALGDNPQLWDEFESNRYRLSVALDATTGRTRHHDETTVDFGVREIATKGTQFVLNGRPISFRGTLECCIFPKTGYPPCDVASWRRIIRICQAHGLNHIRFHSHCPPEAAFVAADGLGFYFQIECGSWANSGARVGSGGPLDQWLYDEADRILRAYGNHPSFVLMAYGNEPAGPGRGGRFLGPWVTHYRNQDGRRLYTSAAGWPILPENQYHNTPEPRIHAWGMGLKDRLNGQPPATTADYRSYVQQHRVPVISHEIGQWCVYPNFAEISKYTGVLQPMNFLIFRDFLAAHHMADQASEFVMASGKLQTLCYKEEIESTLRTPGMGGFQLLDLHDFPGQGTALVGVLDPFWDSKPYVSPAEFRRFCNHIVPLARLPKRVVQSGATLKAAIEVYQFGPRDLKDSVVRWELQNDEGTAVDSGALSQLDLPTGRWLQLGTISIKIPKVSAAEKLHLVVGLQDTDYENDWDLWVYPPEVPIAPPQELLITEQLSDRALGVLADGGKVMLTPRPESIASDVALGFTTVFWNTAWTRNQAPHTLGILCDPAHAAWNKFPTEYHTNWQWWELVQRASAMVLDDLPSDLRPLVQVIDTWFEARRLGLVFEGKVGQGKLLVCSMDIAHDLDTRPVARQMRYSLINYMCSDQFDPDVSIDVDDIRRLLRPN